MKSNLRFYIFFLLSFYATVSLSQSVVKHFTIEDGLPSDEVHFVHQDKQGYFWFCTDRGISRYNGYEFTNFTTADGLTNNVVFKCFEDWDGNMWFTCIDGSITIYDSNLKQFEGYEHYNWLKSKYLAQSWVHNIGFRKKSKEVYFFMLDNYPNATIYKVDSFGFKGAMSKDEFLLNEDRFFDDLYVHGLVNRNAMTTWEVGYGGANLRANSPVLDELEHEELSIYPSFHFIDSNLFICTRGGVTMLDKNGVHSDFKIEFASTSIIKDKEGLYWVTSENGGVYVVSSELVKTYDLQKYLAPNEKIRMGRSLKGSLVVGLHPAKFAVLSPASGAVQEFPWSQKYYGFDNLFYNDDSTGVHFNGDILVYSANVPHYRLTKKKAKSFGSFNVLFNEREYADTDLLPNKSENLQTLVGESSLIFGDRFTEWQIKHHKFISEFQSGGKGFVRKYAYYKDFVYVGSRTGLKKIYADSREFEGVDLGLKFESLGVYDLDTIHQVTILATKGHGVICVKDDSVVANLDIQNSLLSKVVNTFYIDRTNQTLWCGTDKGISVFNYKIVNDSLHFVWVKNIRKIDGLFSNYINDIEIVGDRAMAISNYGISSIPINFISAVKDLPQVSLLGYINGDSTYFENNEHFSYDQNNIEFNYELVSMRRERNTYRYRLVSEGDSVKWTETDDRSVRIDNLAPGSYTFQVCARIADGNWSVPEGYRFIIKPRFIDLWWVRVLAVLVLFGLLYLGYRKRISRIEEQSEMEIALKTLELKNAKLESSQLRGQMNPHFMFNVLNSIQKMILKEEKENANKLLSRFSKLVRASLKYSRLEFIPLADEVEFLDNYISIEGQRYPDRFKYSIDIDARLQQDEIKVPPLLIQPLCENAIKHAFVNGDGTVYVRIIMKDEKTIIVEVIDNGIGILNKPQKDEGSLGISIINERLALFENEGYETQLEIVAADVNTKKGTRAILTIPYI